MIAVECSGCGRLEVLADAELERRAADPSPPGHHVVPGDADADWICYGKPERIADDARRDLVRSAFRDRSIHGLEAHQPSKAECARRRESVDGRRRQERHAADLTSEDARLRDEFAKEAP